MKKDLTVKSWEDRPLLDPEGISQEDWNDSFDD